MIAGNPDHRDDASQPLSRFIKTFPILMIKVVIDTFTTLHDNGLPALSVSLVIWSASHYLSIFSHGIMLGPGPSITL